MNIQRFLAPTSREALAKARSVFGEGTLILSNRATAQGVEVMATAEDHLQHMDRGQKTSTRAARRHPGAGGRRNPPLAQNCGPIIAPQAPAPKPVAAAVAPRMAAPVHVSPRQSVAEDTEQLAMSTLSFQDYVRERMLRRRSEGIQAAELPEDQLPTFARKARQDSAKAPAMPRWCAKTPCVPWPQRCRPAKTWRPAPPPAKACCKSCRPSKA